MVRRFNTVSYVVFALLAIGVIAWFMQDPISRIIPIVVFGGIYLLYKFPPGRTRPRGPSRFSAPPRSKAKKRIFRVIPGNKPRSDDDPHRFH